MSCICYLQSIEGTKNSPMMTKHLWKRFQNVRQSCVFWQIGSKSTNWSHKCVFLTFSTSYYRAVIGGFRYDLSITHKTDGNFGNVSAFPRMFCFPKSRINENGCNNYLTRLRYLSWYANVQQINCLPKKKAKTNNSSARFLHTLL